MSAGIRRTGYINRVCKLLQQHDIPFKRSEIEDMGLGQLKRKIRELDPNNKIGIEYRKNTRFEPHD